MLRVSHWLIPVLRGSGITSMSYASGFASILDLQSAPEFRISEFVSRRPRIGVPNMTKLDMIFKETARVSQQEQVMSNINPLFMTTSMEP
jgi:hypothetical protein